MKPVFGKLMRQVLLLPMLLLGVMLHGAAAEVSLNINIGPPVVVGVPPAVVLVPGSRVYFVPDFNVDIFFYGGYWWSPRGDRWYRAHDHSGPWRAVSRSVVPRPVYRIPGNYRQVYAKERHIPYGQWQKDRGGRRGSGKGGGGEFRGREDRGRDDHKGRDRGRDDRGGHGRGRD